MIYKCNKWYDLKCAKMEEYNFKIHDLDNTLQWICPYCIDSYCSKCDIPFKRSQNCVCYDSCDKWLHLKCPGLKLAQLSKIKNDTWFCKTCCSNTFPFHDIDNNKLYKCLDINKPKPKQIVSIPNLETYCKISKVCNKKVRQPYNSLPCKKL